MEYIVNAREMKTCDENTSSIYHVSPEVLMEKAALAVVEEIEKRYSPDTTIGILCGTGNNGGDGICVARILFEHGYQTYLYVVGDKKKFSLAAKKQWDIATAYAIKEVSSTEELCEADILVDGLFGTGLSRDIDGECYSVIEKLNQKQKCIFAIDIPSGIRADDGHVCGIVLKCKYTITFAFLKLGHRLYPGASYCGKVICKNIGILPVSFGSLKPQCFLPENKDLLLLKQRDESGNKGTFGKALIIAGSSKMCGAAILCAASALKTGCGMVKVFTHENNRNVIYQAIPEALVETYENKINEQQLLDAMKWADVICFGPGIGMDANTRKMVPFILKNAAVPMVIDADALNILAEDMEMLRKPHTEIIVTPHVGEMSRMRQESILYVKDHLISVAQEFAREYNVICVLKDATTITAIPYSKTFINPTGNSGMATAGSGDVLAGMLTGLVAMKNEPALAAPLGVYMHGFAGDFAADAHGKESMVARDIVNNIQKVYSMISDNKQKKEVD